jgi:hypothetical protein
MTRKRRLSGGVAVTVVAFLCVVAAAFGYGFEEEYGHKTVCSNGCYIQSAGAHTFVYNSGWHTGTGEPYLACQLYNGEGENVVENETGTCNVKRGNNGKYVWARVYDESGGSGSEGLAGWAHTS